MSQLQDNESSELTSRKSSKPYKIVLESVTQEKKKLQYTISYNDQAPPGYTFIPVGIPELTEYCKELSREKGLDVYVVSTAPQSMAHLNPKHISHHIHRIGHHFRNQIVEQACDLQGYRQRGHAYVRHAAESFMQPQHLARKLDSHGQRLGLQGQNPTSNQSSQQVRATIKELFPKIPKDDLEAIVTRAFEEGTNRVGNAESIPLPRRVQLAVVAHIRHRYTDYDTLLHVFSWHQARQIVEQPCLDQIVQWRDEDETDVVELEDIFREVIIIDDDDDDDYEVEEAERDKKERSGRSSGEPNISTPNFVSNAPISERESSVEIISTRIRHDGTSGEESSQGESEPVLMRSKARTIGPISKRSIPEIVHVQPQRDMRKAPVLTWQEQLQRRYSEARARRKRASESIPISPGDQNQPSLPASSSLHPAPSNQSVQTKPNAPNIGLKSFAQRVDELNGNPKQLPLHLRPMYVPLSHQSTAYDGRSGEQLNDHLRPIYVPAQPDQDRFASKTNRVVEGGSSEYLRSNLEQVFVQRSNENLRPSGYGQYPRSNYVGKRKSYTEISDGRALSTNHDILPKRQRVDPFESSSVERRSDAPMGSPAQRSRRSEVENYRPKSGFNPTEVIDLTSSPGSSKSRIDRQPLSSGNSPRSPLPPPPPPQQRIREGPSVPRATVMVDKNGRRFYPARDGDDMGARERGIPQYDGAADYPDQYYPSQGYGRMPARRPGDMAYTSYANGWTGNEWYDRRQAVSADPAHVSQPGLGKVSDVRHSGFAYEPGYEYEYIEPHFREMQIGNSRVGPGSNRASRPLPPSYSASEAYPPRLNPQLPF